MKTSLDGLSTAEAHQRLAGYGPNELRRQGGTRWWRDLVRQLIHPLALLLWLAAVLAWIAGTPVLAAAIVAVILINAERIIAVPAQCLTALRQHRAAQNAERKSAGKDWKDSGLVFTTGIGTPIEPRNLNRHFGRLLDRAGLRRIRFHDLRHSCATLLYEQGVPIEKIQDILGHSSPTITKLIYVEVTRQSQRASVDKLGFLFDA